MSAQSSLETQPVMRRNGMFLWVLRGIGALLLLLVGYIHLAIMVNMFGLSQMLGKLFLLNAIGAFAALTLVLATPKWYGWLLGILVAGGAAFAKLGMTRIPALRTFIMGGRGRFGPRGGTPPNGAGNPSGQGSPNQGSSSGGGAGSGHAAGSQGTSAASHAAGAHAGHFGGPVGHSVLPVFGNVRTLGTQSVVIEIAFVVLALIALFALGSRRTA